MRRPIARGSQSSANPGPLPVTPWFCSSLPGRRPAARCRLFAPCLIVVAQVSSRCLLDGWELRTGPFGVDDELEWTHLLVAESHVVERTTPQCRQRLARGITHEPQVCELQRQHVVATLRQSTHGPNEGILALSSEQVECGGPLLGREHLHSLAVRLPVAGGLVIDALDEVVAHDEIG